MLAKGQYPFSCGNLFVTQAKVVDLYRPVVREEGGEWGRLANPVEFESQI